MVSSVMYRRDDRPFVVLLEHDRSDEPDDGIVVGEDFDDIGPALDLLVEAFEPVGGLDLRPMLRGKAM